MSSNVIHRLRPSAVTFGAAVLGAVLTACAGQADPPLGTSPPIEKPVLPIETITPQYAQLTIDRTTDPAPTVPWQLIKVDPQENRIYLSASSSGCSHPRKVRVTETAASIQITVTGAGGGDPCSMQYETLMGYVQLGSIGDRQVTGNAG
jgi:hypothetical protein